MVITEPISGECLSWTPENGLHHTPISIRKPTHNFSSIQSNLKRATTWTCVLKISSCINFLIAPIHRPKISPFFVNKFVIRESEHHQRDRFRTHTPLSRIDARNIWKWERQARILLYLYAMLHSPSVWEPVLGDII